MYRQRIQEAWGRTAHRGWARLLLNRALDLIIHGKGKHDGPLEQLGSTHALKHMSTDKRRKHTTDLNPLGQTVG